MRCKNCDYTLWNLRTRNCPECGVAFAPGDFEFAPSSVQFCCPACDQAYYGTDRNGHLVPREFSCVKCGAPVRMDEMVLRPAAGVADDATRARRLPWIDDEAKGFWKRWFRTVGMSIGHPTALATAAHERGAPGKAWRFAVYTLLLYALSGIGLFGLFIAAMITFAEGDPEEAVMALGGFLLGVIGFVVVAAAGIALWGLTTQACLTVLGHPRKPVGTTFTALCYSAGVNVFLAVPLFGIYCGIYFIPIWWIIVACVMMVAMQGPPAWKPVIATLVFPGIVVVGSMVLFFGAMYWGMQAATSRSAAFAYVTHSQQAQTMALSVLSHARGANGSGPAHAVEMVSTAGLAPEDFVSSSTYTQTWNVPVAESNLGAFATIGADGQGDIVTRAAAALPANVTAHRLGDCVFTYHGIDFTTNPDPQLWIVVICDDPDTMQMFGAAATIDPIWVGLANGTTTSFPRGGMSGQLQAQNQVRAASGLPPLTDPLVLTHGKPATGQ